MFNIDLEDILQEIAIKNGISVKEVAEDIMEAINMTWDKPNSSQRAAQKELFGTNKPTVEEFIKVISKNISQC